MPPTKGLFGVVLAANSVNRPWKRTLSRMSAIQPVLLSRTGRQSRVGRIVSNSRRRDAPERADIVPLAAQCKNIGTVMAALLLTAEADRCERASVLIAKFATVCGDH